MKSKIKRILVIIVSLGIILLAAALMMVKFSQNAIYNYFNKVETAPCKTKTLTQIGFGYLKASNGTAVEFSTEGGTLYVLPQGMKAVSVLDLAYATEIIFGNTDQQKPYRTDNPANIKLTALKNKYNPVDLPKGRYWIAVDRSADITIASCDPDGVSDPKPVQ